MDFLHDKTLIHRYLLSSTSAFFLKHRIAIMHPKGILIEGLPMGSNISLAFGSVFSGNPTAETIKTLTQSAGNFLMGSKITDGISNTAQAIGSYLGYSSQLLIDTISKYQSSSPIDFTVTIFIMKEHTDYKSTIQQSLRLTSPSLILEDLLIKSPMDYKPDDLKGKDAVNESNTCTILVGERLRLTHMVCTAFTYSESQQLRTDGAPMYLTLSYTFQTGRILDYLEYTNWFLNM